MSFIKMPSSLFKRIGRYTPTLLQIRPCSSQKQTAPLAGKVALVTASTEGIGFSIARRLCKDGAKVVISSRKEKKVAAAVENLSEFSPNVTGCVCHVGNRVDRQDVIKHAIDKFGQLDILVSNAAANPAFGSVLETTEEAWDKIFEVNIKGAFFLCKEAMPHLQKSKNGSVIFIASIASYSPVPMLGAYSISKTGLLGLVKVLSTECAPMGVRINCVAPGLTKTNFSKALWNNPVISETFLKDIPLGRYADPDECSGIVSFLASQDSSYITGETIVVAGGMHSHL